MYHIDAMDTPLIKATPAFVKKASKALTEEALQGLVDHLTLNPDAGDVIAGTGGLRKLRWQTGKGGKGKRGGVRVLYYYGKEILLVLMIDLYQKSEKENIDAGEKAELKKKLPQLIKQYREKKEG